LELFIVRHAIAAERSTEQPDSERPLTAEGRERFAAVVRGLELLGVRLDLVLHSPWTRAAETAALLAPLAAGPGRSTHMLSRAPSPDLIHELSRLGAAQVAVVGHEPWLSELVAWLVAGDAALGYAFGLKKGGVAHLDGQPVPGAMRLLDFWRPKTLRELGERGAQPGRRP